MGQQQDITSKENRVRFEDSNDREDDDSDYENDEGHRGDGKVEVKSSSLQEVDTSHDNSVKENKLDPVRAVIDAVIQKTGVERSKVSALVNVMFDMGLAYDDPNEVIAELQKVNEKEKKGGSGDSDVNVTEKDGTKSKTRNKNNNKKNSTESAHAPTELPGTLSSVGQIPDSSPGEERKNDDVEVDTSRSS